MIRKARLRAALFCCVMVLIFSIFSYRLIYLQVDKSADYAALANLNQTYKLIIPAQRGSICDAHGEILADDMPMRKVIVDGSHLKPDAVPKVAALLARLLDLDQKALAEKLTPDRRYLVVKRQVSVQTAEDLKTALEQQKLHGVSFEPDSARNYPDGALLCHVVGFTDFDGTGVQGVEKSMNQYLEGHSGYRYITRDRAGQELVQDRGLEEQARNGDNVQLTIDLGLQSIVERELDAAMKKYTPETACAIIMRPQTGEILALANRPNFDLTERATAKPEEMKNRAIIDQYEPGSTFKIVTLSGVLNEGLVKPETEIFCENGRWQFAGKILHDDHPVGNCSVHDVLVHSSNIGAAKLAMQLGQTRLYNYIKLLGFGDRTGIDLPGEIVGDVPPTKEWHPISISRIPMGQGVAVTPIQMTMAMGAMANGGKLMMPQIIHSITDEKGNPIAEFPPVAVRQAVKPEVVKQMVSALQDVVSPRGTAKGAAVPGFYAAGKTGTAQKQSPHGGYMSGKYIVSFVGFVPADKPELVCLVMINNANTKPHENYGGLVAAPIFSAISDQALRYLNVERELPDPLPAAANAVLAKNGKSAHPEPDRD
jgi:cell division protein FtsI/penicillin-binding protein 2